MQLPVSTAMNRIQDDTHDSSDMICDLENGIPNRQSHDKSHQDVKILDWEPNDKHNPANWSNTRKWLVASVALFGTLILTLNGTSVTIAAMEIDEAFNVSDSATFTNSYWAVTSWSMGGAVFIIIGLPLLEDLGVRVGYLAFYALFLVVIVPQAVAQNYATLVVTRFFSGGCVSLLANTISSMIPDLWEGEKARTLPVSLYIITYVGGSTLGPTVFAPVMQYVGNWRWIFYIQLIIYGAYFPLFIISIRETRGNVILRRRAKALRKKTGDAIFTQSELDAPPLHKWLLQAVSRPIYLLFTEPVLLASAIWSAFSFGTVFLFTQSVTQVFTGLYGWKEYSTGYVLGAVVVGECIGWLATIYSARIFLKSADSNDEFPGQPIPEARLYMSIFGSFFGTAGGMFVYAWTSYPTFPWIAPAIGLAMVGFGIQIVVSAAADYVVDAYAASGYAGSAISAVAAMENILAAFMPLAAQSMYTRLGFQWASSLLGFIALLLSLAPVLFVWKGKTFRARSPFMQSGGQTKGFRKAELA